MRYAFIGLGELGGKLAGCLLRAGFPLIVHDRNPDAVAPLVAEGATAVASPREAAAQVDAVFTCLPSPAASEAVLAGADGILAGLAAGGTWIEISTLDRDTILHLAARAAKHGVRTLESPVTGGVHLAAIGAVAVLAGGDADLLALHRPALAAMGREVLHMGPLGSAAVMKVITNMLAFTPTSSPPARR